MQEQPAPEDLHIADAPQSHADKLTASQAMSADDTAILPSFAKQQTADQQVHKPDEQQMAYTVQPAAAAIIADLPQDLPAETA